MGKITIKYLVLGMVQTNVFLVCNEETKECVIIDPAERAKRIEKEIEAGGYTAVKILLTHGHFDHILAVNELCRDLGVEVWAHENELPILARPGSTTFGVDYPDRAVKPDRLLKDGDEFDLIGVRWKVIHTPGHTTGSVCYYIEEEKLLFAGDTLFEGSFGRTDLATGSFEQIRASLLERLFVLPDDVQVFPGHEGFTTIGREKRFNEIFLMR